MDENDVLLGMMTSVLSECLFTTNSTFKDPPPKYPRNKQSKNRSRDDNDLSQSRKPRIFIGNNNLLPTFLIQDILKVQFHSRTSERIQKRIMQIPFFPKWRLRGKHADIPRTKSVNHCIKEGGHKDLP